MPPNKTDPKFDMPPADESLPVRPVRIVANHPDLDPAYGPGDVVRFDEPGRAVRWVRRGVAEFADDAKPGKASRAAEAVEEPESQHDMTAEDGVAKQPVSDE